MFVAVDGEGVTLDGFHRYTLLAASDGSYIEDYNGLPTLRCLDYLLSLGGKGKVLVSFSFYYDVSMIVGKDLSPEALKSLSRNGVCHVKGGPDGKSYRIEYFKRKRFDIKLGHELQTSKGRKWVTKKSVTIFDVFGFFQTSFVNALITWGIASREELESMEAMKSERSNFALQKPEDIRAYNFEECTRLVTIMDKLEGKLLTMGLKLRSWHGAGAVAGAVLKAKGAKAHLPSSESAILRRAYFGGRIQTLKLGRFNNVYSYDIRSAYPYAMSQLPQFYNYEPEMENDGIDDYDIVKVKWNTNERICPFPFRLANKSIQFYSSGMGYYHASEVQAALKVLGPKAVEVLEVWRIPYAKHVKPFAWIDEYYQARAIFRAAKDEVHIAIKLALNSLYGKTAQKVGYRGSTPPYRSFMVAGAITAKCRSMLYEAVAESMDDCIMFATDGIASTSRLKLPLGEDLGQWEETEYASLDVYQAGFYTYLGYPDEDGEVKRASKTRSVHPKAVDWDYVREEWLEHDVNAVLKLYPEQFTSLGLMSANNPIGQWRKPLKQISLKPNKGRPRPGVGDAVELFPLPGPEGVLSSLYMPTLDPELDTTLDPEESTGYTEY